jgi:hypothetical protein
VASDDDNADLPERYVRLCLRVGAHVDDFVDAYIGPAGLRHEILAEEPLDPNALRDEARVLLEEAPRAGLEDDRVEWLRGQLGGIECVTARLAGEEIAWSDEVERCFGIRPHHVDEAVFRASHARLDEVLPGKGDVGARYNAWIESSFVPREALPSAVDALAAEMRRRTAGIVDLPPGEGVEFETVEGEPWQAFNWYRGDFRSRIQVNLDMPFSIVDLVDLVAHETYPGHHTERACKERHLYRDEGRHEMGVMIVSAPEAVVAEGIATNAVETGLGPGGFREVLPVAVELGFEFDAGVADVVHGEEWELFGAAANAARMLHEDEMAPDEAESYLQEWALQTPERAAKTVAFLQDAGSWTYVTAYTDGRRLARSYIDRERDGFARLLTEQLTVSSLLRAGA